LVVSAVVIDLFSRQVAGWSLRDDMRSRLAVDALRIGWLKHQLAGQSAKQSQFVRSVSGLIMHHKGFVQRGFH
jgi:transposase InsO family protein